MAYASATTTASGSTVSVVVPFPYMEQEHVNVTLDGVLVAWATLEWPSSSQITLPTMPGAGVIIEVYRETPASVLDTVFSNPAALDARELNSALRQLLYVAQEGFDYATATYEELAGYTDYINSAVATIAAYLVTASGYVTAALGHKDAAETAEGAAVAAQAAAEAAQATAEEWATKLGSPVETTEYSAKHWAQIAASYGGGALTFIGTWSPAGGTFPAGATQGSMYIASDGGTIDGVAFLEGDQLIGTTAAPSTTVYAANWQKTGGVSSDAVINALGYTPVTNARTITASGLVTGGGSLTANRTVTVTAATEADIKTGTSTTTAMTPKGLADGANEASGYVKLAADGKLPAIDGSLLTNLPLTTKVDRTTSTTIPIGVPVLCYNVGSSIATGSTCAGSQLRLAVLAVTGDPSAGSTVGGTTWLNISGQDISSTTSAAGTFVRLT